MNSDGRYVLKETVISMVINIIISAGFMFLVFGRTVLIDLWGGHGLAVDFIPQTFMISAMSIIVPSLLTRARISSGRLHTGAARQLHPLLHNLALRSFLIATALTILMAGMATAILGSVWTHPQPFYTVLPFKLAFGALVAALATPIGLRLVLSEPHTHVRKS